MLGGLILAIGVMIWFRVGLGYNWSMNFDVGERLAGLFPDKEARMKGRMRRAGEVLAEFLVDEELGVALLEDDWDEEEVLKVLDPFGKSSSRQRWGRNLEFDPRRARWQPWFEPYCGAAEVSVADGYGWERIVKEKRVGAMTYREELQVVVLGEKGGVSRVNDLVPVVYKFRPLGFESEVVPSGLAIISRDDLSGAQTELPGEVWSVVSPAVVAVRRKGVEGVRLIFDLYRGVRREVLGAEAAEIPGLALWVREAMVEQEWEEVLG